VVEDPKATILAANTTIQEGASAAAAVQEGKD
jgi:hypothetical protein